MESPRPRRRLKAKTAVAAMPQATVVGRPLSPEPEAPQARQALGAREVFLVTFPHPKKERSEDGYPLTAPGSLSKADVLDRLLNACQSPVYLDAKNILACPPVPLLKTGISGSSTRKPSPHLLTLTIMRRCSQRAHSAPGLSSGRCYGSSGLQPTGRSATMATGHASGTWCAGVPGSLLPLSTQLLYSGQQRVSTRRRTCCATSL